MLTGPVLFIEAIHISFSLSLSFFNIYLFLLYFLYF